MTSFKGTLQFGLPNVNTVGNSIRKWFKEMNSFDEFTVTYFAILIEINRPKESFNFLDI